MERIEIPLASCLPLVTVVEDGCPLDGNAITAVRRAGWRDRAVRTCELSETAQPFARAADADLWERDGIYARLIRIEDGSGCYYAMVYYG